jgi:Uma2 family endonuclease
LHRLLLGVFGRLVNRESPIDVAPEDNPTNEPEPDLIVLKRDPAEFRDNPRSEDVDLVVEVADSTLSFDRGIKARLYARAGIADYWVLDINGRRMIVHRDPRDGRYQSVVAYGIDESISPLAAPGAALRVRDAFID